MANRVYLIDFGLSKRFIDPNLECHVNHVLKTLRVGTPTFQSRNACLGMEQGRGDDLEAIGNVLIYFINNTLPWT